MVKRWKSTIEKKGSLSRIDPGMACTSFSPHDNVLYACIWPCMGCMDVCWWSPYCNVPPAWCTWARTFESLTAKRWKSTMGKKGALSRIDPGMACSLGGCCGATVLWGYAIPAPMVSPPMLLALYSVLMIMHLALYRVYGCGLLRSPYCNVPPAWCTWAPTFESLMAKRSKSTMEKKGASSGIDPGTACPRDGLPLGWGAVGLRHPSTRG